MKELIIINGPMGIGKSTVSQRLARLAAPAAYLDGDWCWQMHPFCPDAENRAMVIKNICFLLRSFLENSHWERVLFCWVIPEEEIFSRILRPLDDLSFRLHKITLLATPETLEQRLRKDIASGLRQADCLERGLSYLQRYGEMDTIKLYTDDMSPDQAAAAVLRLVQEGGEAWENESSRP